jgi:hypothetical protein
MVSPGIVLCRGAASQTIGGVLSVVSRKDPVVRDIRVRVALASLLRLFVLLSILPVVLYREKHLAPRVKAVGVTNVTGLRWTR